MARKAKSSSRGNVFPIVNFTNFSFDTKLSPLFKTLILVELVCCGLCVAGTLVLVILKLAKLY